MAKRKLHRPYPPLLPNRELENQMTRHPSTLWLPPRRSENETRVRLLCLPYAGGGASVYRPWTRSFPSAVEVLPIRLPGREERFAEALITRMDILVEALAEVISTIADRPFALFGHSLGALVAHELTRHLENRDLPSPVHLFVSAFRAPQLPSRSSPIRALPEGKFVQEILEMGGTPEGVLDNLALREIVLPILRADFTLAETTLPDLRAPLSCPISAFGGLADAMVPSEDLGAWAVRTAAPFKLRMLPGDHFFLRDRQDDLATAISTDLATFLG